MGRDEIASMIKLSLAAHHQHIEQQVQLHRKLLREKQRLLVEQSIKLMRLKRGQASFAKDNLKLILRRQRVAKAQLGRYFHDNLHMWINDRGNQHKEQFIMKETSLGAWPPTEIGGPCDPSTRTLNEQIHGLVHQKKMYQLAMRKELNAMETGDFLHKLAAESREISERVKTASAGIEELLEKAR